MDTPMKYFAFSLYSSNRANFNSYAKGAYENMITIKNNYPDFKCLFFIADDCLENEYVKRILESDSEVILKKNESRNQKSVLWRFDPLINDNFDICFFRDCDSRITKREDNLIKLFIKSDKNFHVIRDYPHKRKILAGMWGVKKTTPDMKKCIEDLYDMDDSYGFEEKYFEKTMWEYIKEDLLLHCFSIVPNLFVRNNDSSFIGQPYK